MRSARHCCNSVWYNEDMSEQTPQQESFIKKQLKLAVSTLTITTVGTLSIAFWLNLALFSLFIICAFILASIIGVADQTAQSDRVYTTVYGNSTSNHKVLSIPLFGPIEGSKQTQNPVSIFGVDNTVYGYEIKQEIKEAADSQAYSGLVLEVNSPGGTIYGSKAIADGVQYFKEKTKKPVYVSVQGLAASGSYWVSASADKIFADSGTGIGSIGVIYGPFTYFDKVVAIDGGVLGGGVATQNGIEQEYITAGEGKDAGNPFRRLTDTERAIMQQGVNNSYEQFISYVSKRRGIPLETLQSSIGAHLYGENQALQNKLIDGIASREEVYKALASSEGNQNNFYVESSHAPEEDFWRSLGVNYFNKQKQSAKNVKPLICTGSVTQPLALHGDTAQFCDKE